ncbi:MAG: lipocalin family protein [Flavobacteriaceae bacterium]|jgi:hypothetical protein|nr:lipocalin family protein [Flavobacteriaceae bacterium]CAI8295083.1 MAG: Uncharacterised protein [Flavobacteriaceae bacterium]|tara:strand:- start:468 stop:875 length:408 start_codon:yes stop_codon:yes gene_type:complete
MKKIIYLFVATTLLISYSADGSTADLDPIIGIWQLESQTEDGIEITTECERNTALEFFEDGNHTSEIFYLDGVDCLSYTDTSTWENLSGSTYRLDNVAEDEATLIFSENNTVFSFIKTEIISGDTYDFTLTFRKL